MKLTLKLFFFAIIIILFNKTSIAQIEENYHWFSANISIPIIVNHHETFQRNNADKKTKHIPYKNIYASISVVAKNMRVTGNNFSGINHIGSEGYDDIQTFHGKISEDKKTIEYIEISRDYTLYSIPDRKKAYVEKKTNVFVRIENIPFDYGLYKSKYGVSKISSVKFKEEYMIKRFSGTTSYTENFVKINNEMITKYTRFATINFKPGNANPKLQEDAKIAVINQSKEIKGLRSDNVMTGLTAIITGELMKIPDLVVLERAKMHKILDEIELSKSGLVNEQTKVESGKFWMWG